MRVIVVDDDQLVEMSLTTILQSDPEIEVVGQGHDGTEAVELYKEKSPDIVLMDIQMKEMSGLEASEKILSINKEAKILLLTTFSDEEYIVKALEIGVKGYILKQDFEAIIPALKSVYGGQSVFGGEVVSKIPVLTAPKSTFSYEEYDISEKEQEVIEQVAMGKSNREIAHSLFLSEGTVRNYISSILEKLSLRDRTQLAVFYLVGGDSCFFKR